ncbi:MAG TPA: MlaD family protein [Solirubrobacterales bacterium]|nr:MlaD family protein [Solirubrobacterales bacterium]
MIKRLLIAGLLVAAVVAVILVVSGDDEGSDGYKVRAVFDSGGFMVTGEEVRVAGATVGTIDAVDVSLPGETVAYRDGEPVENPGKAIIVMEIEDEGFRDFRVDGGCHIRPQSLIGEKFVDCRPTLPRAPGSPPPPELKQLPDDQPGAGQYLLPLGSNTASVDPDLINNIQRLPEAQRFRLILNELGAGFAARGADIEEVVKRANPVLRDTDRLFAILSRQRDELAQLASDSDEILEPFARERQHVAGFFSNSGAAAEASAEFGEDVEASFAKFPRFLREFRATMRDLKGFSDAAAPVFEDLGTAAPSLTDATRTLAPFSEASTVALKSLGATGEVAGPILAQTDPIAKKSRDLAKSGVQPTRDLADLFVSLEQTKGWDGLVELIYNTAATTNGFDRYGHFTRSLVTLSNCTDYIAGAGSSGCASRFTGPFAAESATTSIAALSRLIEEQEEATQLGLSAEALGGGPATGLGEAEDAEEALGEAEAGISSNEGTAGTEPLIDYLLGP